MKIKLAVVAVALTIAPTLSLAAGCSYGKQQQAMTCATGSIYDADAGKCVPATT